MQLTHWISSRSFRCSEKQDPDAHKVMGRAWGQGLENRMKSIFELGPSSDPGGLPGLNGVLGKKQVWPPMFEPRIFGSNCTVLKKVLATLFWLFGARGHCIRLLPPRYAPNRTSCFADDGDFDDDELAANEASDLGYDVPDDKDLHGDEKDDDDDLDDLADDDVCPSGYVVSADENSKNTDNDDAGGEAEDGVTSSNRAATLSKQPDVESAGATSQNPTENGEAISSGEFFFAIFFALIARHAGWEDVARDALPSIRVCDVRTRSLPGDVFLLAFWKN